MNRNVLVLGGTRFLGRHIVNELARDGARVVCFHRGRSNCELPSSVQERFGDRNVDLSAVDTQTWDAIVNVSGQEPQQLERSLQLRADRYLLISTVSVYRDFSAPGKTEEAPVIETIDPDDEASRYGGNKAASERLVREGYGERATILRPGLIAGRWDFTGRFTYWCRRLLRGGAVLAPAPRDSAVQFVNAADVARFVARALTRKTPGTFNVVGPGQPATIQQLLDACAEVGARRGAPPSRLVWIDRRRIFDSGVAPWSEMPLTLPDEVEWSGMLQVSNAKALAAGLELRPVAQTIAAALDWDQPEPPPAGLSEEREAELLRELDLP